MEWLLVFCKNPIAGQVKTRLAKTIGETAATAVYEQLCSHTRRVLHFWGGAVAVFHASRPLKNNLWEQDHWYQKEQQGQGLGERMQQAIEWAFAQGATKVCLIGSDLWTLTPTDIQEAFRALDYHPIVWGPATDGGYYLIGLTEPQPELFHTLPWSQPDLLKKSQARLPRLSQFRLREQNDIDTLEDLKAHPDLYKTRN
jgi:rSAM/selenodomain-associated transferase 1